VLGSPDANREFLVRSCGILIHEDSVVVQEGSDGRGGSSYALPGGHLEFGETVATCLSREIFEEAGLNVEADKLVYVHENFYTLKRVRTHEIGFYFLVDLNSEFPRPDPNGYIASREAHIRIRLLPVARLSTFPLMPAFLRDELPRDAADRFSRPTRHLVSRED
jgi:ADP-ribose pyrophosphatase YjhB (NUDIX family)